MTGARYIIIAAKRIEKEMAKDQLTYLQCHAFRHEWDEVSVLKEPSFGVACDFRCVNCHAVKREIFSRMTGDLLSRYYKLPEDYRGPVGTTKADYRRVWLDKKLKAQRRLKVIANESA